jgi:tetratricopeptide (TPR) repeat protein
MLVRLKPTGLGWLLLGNAHRAHKAYPAAEAAYRKALELDSALDEAHFNLGLLAIDNAVGDSDELVRLQKAVESLKTYRSRGSPDPTTKARLQEYIEASEKRISREAKRRERDRKRQAEDAAKAAAPPEAAPPEAAPPEAAPPEAAPTSAVPPVSPEADDDK